ncbi:hypothetical protein ACLKA7_011878 [Drosophila subpalustris]
MCRHRRRQTLKVVHVSWRAERRDDETTGQWDGHYGIVLAERHSNLNLKSTAERQRQTNSSCQNNKQATRSSPPELPNSCYFTMPLPTPSLRPYTSSYLCLASCLSSYNDLPPNFFSCLSPPPYFAESLSFRYVQWQATARPTSG